MKFLRVAIVPILLCLVGCASKMPPLPFQNTANGGESVRLVLVNRTNPFLFPTVDSINVAIDGKKVGNIDRKEYVELLLNKGQHKLLLEHWDMVYWPTTLLIQIEKDPTVLEIYSGIVSTKYALLPVTDEEIRSKYKKVEPFK